MIEPVFAPTPTKGLYAVLVSNGSAVAEVLGTVERAPHNPNVWNAKNLRNTIVAQRSTRQLAGLALIREET
jgi:hypothetical protein